MDRAGFDDAFRRALARLGLQTTDLPGLILTAGSEERLLAHIDALPLGATWQDVFPDLPRSWMPGDPLSHGEGKPRGDFDYPTPPRGAAITAVLPQDTTESALSAFLDEVRGHAVVYGAGVVERSAIGTVVNVVLRLDASDEALGAMADWLNDHPQVSGIAVGRLGPGNSAT